MGRLPRTLIGGSQLSCPHGSDEGCKQCRRNDAQRVKRRQNGNHYTKKYEKTPSGFLMRSYRNMQSRVTGVQWRKAHLYKGLSLLPRTEFYAWARDDAEFWRLYRRWVLKGYDQRFTPTVNRIDTRLGYELGNIEWVTHSVNSAMANHKRETTLSRALERLADRVAA